MLRVIATFILFLSSSSWAYECPNQDKYSQAFDDHINQAFEIFLGQIISGSFDLNQQYGYESNLIALVHHVFKGTNTKTVKLTTSVDQFLDPIEIGGSYIFFLFGSNTLDHYSERISLNPDVQTLSALVKFAPLSVSRVKIESLLKYFEDKP